MMYEEVIKDFAIRTKKNLEVIENLKDENTEVYETTQLVNSCLGLLVFPHEHFIERIPKIPLDQLAEQGWPLPKVVGDFEQVENLKELIRHLRNAIAHFNIKFIGDLENQISVLRVWNNNRGRKTWQADLSVDDLKKISKKFSDMLIDYNKL
jgi:hypothetical protein